MEHSHDSLKSHAYSKVYTYMSSPCTADGDRCLQRKIQSTSGGDLEESYWPTNVPMFGTGQIYHGVHNVPGYGEVTA